MFTVIRASLTLMDEVRACINSNGHLYEKIIAPQDKSEHYVDEEWAKRNFSIREFYLARDQGIYVGMGSYQNLGKFAYIGYFYIKPNVQRKGYGRALMKFLETRTQTDGLTDLRLFANNQATWALEFYQHIGFTIFLDTKNEILNYENGLMRPFYEENSLFLQKIIPKLKPLSISSM